MGLRKKRASWEKKNAQNISAKRVWGRRSESKWERVIERNIVEGKTLPRAGQEQKPSGGDPGNPAASNKLPAIMFIKPALALRVGGKRRIREKNGRKLQEVSGQAKRGIPDAFWGTVEN